MSLEIEPQERRHAEAPKRPNDKTQSRDGEIERLIYTISHDLKSPLVTVHGFADLMEQDIREGRTERLAEFAQYIKGGVNQMVRLIDGLLSLSRAGRLQRPPEPVNFTDLARKIVRLHALEIEQSQIDVAVEDGLPVINADRGKMAEIIENLLSNAIKYGSTHAAPRIRIGGQATANEVRFFVQDNGPGIPPSGQDQVFDVFGRIGSNTEGKGVGLAIVKRVMEVHGGRTWVESTPGRGATFWLAFPKALWVQPAPVVAEELPR